MLLVERRAALAQTDGLEASREDLLISKGAADLIQDMFEVVVRDLVVETPREEHLAHEHTDGTISSLRIDSGRLNATFVGEATEAQLNLMLRNLAAAAGDQFEELAAVSEDGSLLYVLTPNAP